MNRFFYNVKRFNRITIPPYIPNYQGRMEYEEFFLNFITKRQRNFNNFNQTPLIFFFRSNKKNEYWNQLQIIQYHLRFLNDKYNLLVYGNNHDNEDLNTILFRIWINKTNKINGLILLEKFEDNYDNNSLYFDKYIHFINNNYWYPDMFFFEKRLKNSFDLIQILEYKNKKILMY